MGECYWHGSGIYPGHPCPECEKDQQRIIRENEWHIYADRMVPKRKYCPKCEIFYLANKIHKCKKEN